MLLFNVCYLVFKDQDVSHRAVCAAEANSIETDPNCQGLFTLFLSLTTDSFTLERAPFAVSGVYT
jgi:hypothetical protein